MTGRYANTTKVAANRTRLEIESLLTSKGCTHIGVMTEPDAAIIYFKRDGWEVQLRVNLPTIKDAPRRPKRRGTFRELTDAQRAAWVEQETRIRWRQLLLMLKAKFTAIESNIELFEQTFLPHLVLQGVHVGERLLPAVQRAKATGAALPLLLPAGN